MMPPAPPTLPALPVALALPPCCAGPKPPSRPNRWQTILPTQAADPPARQQANPLP